MTSAYHRHDISDHVWKLLEPPLPGREGAWGGMARDHRLCLQAVFWRGRTGAPGRDLPPEYGDGQHTHRRFCRWRDCGVWEALVAQGVDAPDCAWLMSAASHLQGHPHAAGATGGTQAMRRTTGGLNPTLPLAVEAPGMPVRGLMTPGTTADWMPAGRVSEGLTAAHVRAARGDDSAAIVAQAKKHGRQPVRPPRNNRQAPREDDTELDRLRRLVESAFLPLKRWRGMAMR